MNEELLKILGDFNVKELYFLQDDAIPTFIIVSSESEEILKKVGELEEIEADIITLTPEEREKLKLSKNEISKVVLNVMEKGEKLI